MIEREKSPAPKSRGVIAVVTIEQATKVFIEVVQPAIGQLWYEFVVNGYEAVKGHDKPEESADRPITLAVSLSRFFPGGAKKTVSVVWSEDSDMLVVVPTKKQGLSVELPVYSVTIDAIKHHVKELLR
jgi:hypothetical protein